MLLSPGTRRSARGSPPVTRCSEQSRPRSANPRSTICGSGSRVSAAASSNVITIVAEAPDSDAAVALATAVVEAYRSETRRQVAELTDAAIASLDASTDQVIEATRPTTESDVVEESAAATIGSLQLQAADLETSRALLGDSVEFAVAPSTESVVEPSFPVRELALGILLGAVLAGTAAWIRADRHRQVVDQDAVSEILQTTCLGEISRTPRRLYAADLPTGEDRLAWTAIAAACPSGHPRGPASWVRFVSSRHCRARSSGGQRRLKNTHCRRRHLGLRRIDAPRAIPSVDRCNHFSRRWQLVGKRSGAGPAGFARLRFFASSVWSAR